MRTLMMLMLAVGLVALVGVPQVAEAQSSDAISLTNQAGDQAWPITAPTFILVPRNPAKPDQVAEALKFFDWAFKNGDRMALELDYVPLPQPVKDMVRKTWETEIKDSSGQPLLKM